MNYQKFFSNRVEPKFSMHNFDISPTYEVFLCSTKKRKIHKSHGQGLKVSKNYTSWLEDLSEEPNMPQAKHWCSWYTQFWHKKFGTACIHTEQLFKARKEQEKNKNVKYMETKWSIHQFVLEYNQGIDIKHFSQQWWLHEKTSSTSHHNCIISRQINQNKQKDQAKLSNLLILG